jgi:hypothetical protein
VRDPTTQRAPVRGGPEATTDLLEAPRITDPGDAVEPELATDPLTDLEIRALGFEPLARDPFGRRCWRPSTSERRESMEAAAAATGAGSYTDPVPFRIPGASTCCVCGDPSEASTVETPTCGAICTAVLMDRLMPVIEQHLYSHGDGSGGLPARRPVPPRPRKRVSVLPTGPVSVERALERLVDCRTVLERHGVDVRWGRNARCPFHDDTNPSMSLYERDGKSRAHCFPCDWDGDAVDLEAALVAEDLKITITKWGSN